MLSENSNGNTSGRKPGNPSKAANTEGSSRLLLASNGCPASTGVAVPRTSGQPAEVPASPPGKEEGPPLPFFTPLHPTQHPSGDGGDWTSTTSSESEISLSEPNDGQLGKVHERGLQDSVKIHLTVKPTTNGYVKEIDLHLTLKGQGRDVQKSSSKTANTTDA